MTTRHSGIKCNLKSEKKDNEHESCGSFSEALWRTKNICRNHKIFMREFISYCQYNAQHKNVHAKEDSS